MVNAITMMFIPPLIVVCLPFHMLFSVVVAGIFGSCLSLTYWPWLAWKSLVLVATSQRVGPFARSLMMLPWLLVAVAAPVLAIAAFMLGSVLFGFCSACYGGWMLIDDGSCSASVELLKDLPSNTADAVHEFGTDMKESIDRELTFRNPRTPIDLNPLHIVEGIVGWALTVVPAILAAVVASFTKMIINIVFTFWVVMHLLTDVDAEYIPCLCCCLPLLIAFLFGLMPAVLLAAAALSPLVALCCSAVYATEAVYVSYLTHYDVPQGTRVSCYWPVLHRAVAGGMYSISIVDELYTMVPETSGCWEESMSRLRSRGLYNRFFSHRFGFAVADGPARAAWLEEPIQTGATAPPAPPADEPQLERQGSSTMAGALANFGGNALNMASVWRSFFDSCESATALALVEGWVSFDAVRGADPSVCIGIPALVVMQAALRSYDEGIECAVALADGRHVDESGLPNSPFAQEVFGQMMQLIGAVHDLQPSNEERIYLLAAAASGGAEEGVRVPLPASLGSAGGETSSDAAAEAGDEGESKTATQEAVDVSAGGEGKESDSGSEAAAAAAAGSEGSEAAAAAAAGSGGSDSDGAAERHRRLAAVRRARNVATQLGLSATRRGPFRRKFARVLSSAHSPN